MKWRPAAEADWYLLAGENMYTEKIQKYQSHLLESDKVRNMQKIRGVHFAILQSWQFLEGQYTGCAFLFIQGVSLRPCTSRNIAQWIVCMERSWCVSAETGITSLGFHHKWQVDFSGQSVVHCHFSAKSVENLIGQLKSWLACMPDL